MKKIFTILSIALLTIQTVFAIPAKPGKFAYKQPDGSVVMVESHGDEHGHWMTNEAGEAVKLGKDGYLHRMDASELSSIFERAIKARSEADENRAARASVTTGSIKVPVILIEFKDKGFTIENPVSAFNNLLNKEGYSANGATGSVRDFYSDNSNGLFLPEFEVYGPVQVSDSSSYYAGSSGTDRAYIAFGEACKLMDSTIDFSKYDSDGDEYVDMILFYYAGYNQAEGGEIYNKDCIWPHESFLYAGPYDGKYIGRYSCTSELKGYTGASMCGIGTACHELGHALGLPYLYDTDYAQNGSCGGLYSFSTMCSGSYNNDGRTPPFFNIEERIFLGWNTADDIEEITTGGTYSLPAFNVGSYKAYKTATTTDNEYFVYECRGANSWDAYIYATGMVVYHVDKSTRNVKIDYRNVRASNLWSNWEAYNGINKNGSHPCFYIVPAADQENLNYGGSNSRMVFPGSGSGRVTEFQAVDWEGEKSDFVLSEIKYSSRTATFKVDVSGMEDVGFNYIYNPGKGTYSAGTKLPLILVKTASEAPSSVTWYYDGSKTTLSEVTLTSGSHTIIAELTYSDGSTGRIKLVLTVN